MNSRFVGVTAGLAVVRVELLSGVHEVCGARLQSRLPERSLRRLLGLIACLVAARYLQVAATAGVALVKYSHQKCAENTNTRR